MRAGEFADGAHVLRAKIDMAVAEHQRCATRCSTASATPHHHRTGDAWCIYPMYDYAHPLSDAIEGVTHSLCTLEFEDHRPLYDWCIEQAGDRAPAAAVRVRAAQPELHGDEQAQAAAAGRAEARRRLGRSAHADARRACAAAATRRNRSATSARASASRRRKTSSTSACSSTACARISTGARRARWRCCARSSWCSRTTRKARSSTWTSSTTPRTRPPARARCRSRARSTSSATTSWKIRRRSSSGWRPGREVRLRNAYLVTCTEVDQGRRRRDRRAARHLRSRRRAAATRPTAARSKATLHWVSAAHAVDAQVRLYDRLFTVEDPDGAAAKTGVGLHHAHQPRVARGAHGLPARADARPTRRRARASSSSGSAISAPIPIRGRARRSSTAPCRSRTPGPGPPPATARDGGTRQRPETLMRVAIVGGPGVGKSTLVRQLADLYHNGSYGEGEKGVWDPRSSKTSPPAQPGRRHRVLRAPLRRQLPRRRRPRPARQGDLLRGRAHHARSAHRRIPGAVSRGAAPGRWRSATRGSPTGSSC